jgi:hypothetical protein
MFRPQLVNPSPGIGLKRIENFIRRELPRKLLADLHQLRIVKEADLEACAYYHLRIFLRGDSGWTVLTRKHVPKTGYYIDILIFRKRIPRISMELKWDRTRISRKDRISLRRSIDRLGVNRAYFLATNTKETRYRKIKKRFLEKHSLFEVIVPLGLTGLDLRSWKDSRRVYRSDMRIGKGGKRVAI